ncbi:hypothetical protein SAMN02745824_0850 [Parasphingorhabdus marina DSM 22363]|uniref:Uncharacterized protein n=1 Tax=Parasphingorhabdus marina DSM 22363 TaxID=1123272 RepID=A0A1N6CS01_9SPHN|nr:hypothetical protein [Parasphingorhabdus marina]SIN61279.1 hypothetical protein SAMN02745824_0850 [Parasphingorhabdus marina DSM 22363]
MTQNPSIWSWTLTDAPEPLFRKLVSASDEEFESEAATAMLAAAPAFDDSFDEALAESEAAEFADDEDWEEDWDGDGEDENLAPQTDIALCTSHMFFDDPWASMEYEEIDRQVEQRLASYRAAISQAVGHEGQRFTDFIGADPATMDDEKAFTLYEMDEWADHDRVWEKGGHIYFLNVHHEDKELPIDIGFGRTTADRFRKLREVAARLT